MRGVPRSTRLQSCVRHARGSLWEGVWRPHPPPPVPSPSGTRGRGGSPCMGWVGFWALWDIIVVPPIGPGRPKDFSPAPRMRTRARSEASAGRYVDSLRDRRYALREPDPGLGCLVGPEFRVPAPGAGFPTAGRCSLLLGAGGKPDFGSPGSHAHARGRKGPTGATGGRCRVAGARTWSPGAARETRGFVGDDRGKFQRSL